VADACVGPIHTRYAFLSNPVLSAITGFEAVEAVIITA